MGSTAGFQVSEAPPATVVAAAVCPSCSGRASCSGCAGGWTADGSNCCCWMPAGSTAAAEAPSLSPLAVPAGDSSASFFPSNLPSNSSSNSSPGGAIWRAINLKT